MAICRGFLPANNVGMQATTQNTSRRLKLATPVRRPDEERKAALLQARRARTELEGRARRFAHLKRMYD